MRHCKPSRVIVECAALEPRRLLCVSGDLPGLSTMPRAVERDDGPIIRATDAGGGPQSIDQLNVPALSSRPSAGRKLYLDFNGHHTIDNWSGWAIGGEDAGPTPAYDIDGDNDSFSFQELDNIVQIWKGVSEKFSPFNIDVTTIQPSKINGAQVVIGGDGAWHGTGGGVGIVGGWGEEGFFDVKGANVAFVWDGQGPGQRSNTAYIVEAIAHEAGHTLGLNHQSDDPLTAPGNEYLAGLIMGQGDLGIGRWANTSVTGGLSSKRDGETIVSAGSQDDLARITGGNGFNFRADDNSNGIIGATLLTLSSQNGVLQAATSGVIEQMPDVDVFRISHAGGSLDIEVLAAEFRGMLDPNLTLTNGSNVLVASSSSNNGSDGVGERIQFNQLNAGTYFIKIAGSGAYGDIGQYRLNVRAGSPQASNDTLGTATRLGAFGRTTAEYLALGFAGTANISDSLAADDKFDYFKIVVPGPAGGMLTARLSGLIPSSSATLAIINDLNGNGIVDSNEATSASGPGNGVLSVSQAVFAGNVRFVRVARSIDGVPVNSYQLRITTDEALDRVTATFPSTAVFDPQPLQGGRLVYESIDPTAATILSVMPDTTDYYRVTAGSAGLFSFFMNQQDFTGDLRLDVGADTDANGTLEASEILGSSAQPNGGSESIQNLAVTAGQQLLVRVSQQTNTSDNYTLQAIADYATGGNLTGSLSGAMNLTAKSAGVVLEYLGSPGDIFDTYRIAPPPGPLTARITPIELGASHRLEIIRDANNNGLIDKGEIVASGFNTELAVNVPDPGLFAIPYYLRVASVADGGEFPSVGNYRLKFVTAGAVTGQTLTSPAAITVSSTQSTTRGYLAFDPDDASLTDLEDYYQFTLASRTRFDVSTGDPTIGVQVGQLNGSSFRRIGGVGDFQGVVNSLSVNLDPGTYLIRTYLSVEERQDEPSGGSFVLSYKTAAITDDAPPLVTASEFQYEIKPVGPIFTVDQDVLGSIDPSDVVVRNLATNATFPIGQTFYDVASHQIGYGVAAGVLPDGNYRATLLAGSIRDASANPVAADFSFDFFVLAGDANRDRKVDVSDLGILATNWQGTGTFSQADFNYDHHIDVSDLGILASNWQQTLAASAAPANAALTIGGPSRPPRRLIDQLELN